MKAKLFFQIVLCSTLYAQLAQGKISIEEPKNEVWLPWLDDDRVLRISGKVSDLSVKELKLEIDKQRSERHQTWRVNPKKDGSFSFEISQYLVYPDSKTQMTIFSIDSKGKVVESTTQFIYCCSSMGEDGFFQELAPGKDNVIQISKKNSVLDGVGLNFPGRGLNEKTNLIISLGSAKKIRLSEYQAVSPAIRFNFSKLKAIPASTEYTLKFYPGIPRNDMAMVMSKEDWENITNREWENVNLKSSDLIVLASDDSGAQWAEFKPVNVTKDKVSFSLPDTEQVRSIFVVAIKNQKK